MPAERKRLLVEGKEDVYTVAELMGNYVAWGKPEPVKIVQCNGEEIFTPGRISAEIKSASIVGVIVDADNDLSHKWNGIRQQILPLFGEVPTDLPEEGLVISTPTSGKFGLWIMPDNRQHGMLETFLSWLVPDEEMPVWTHALESTAAAKFKHGASYRSSHLDKANIHAWLAWADPPGENLGRAVKSKILDPRAGRAAPFVNWFRRLYEV